MASFVFDDYALAARSLEINAEHIELLEELKQVATLRYEAGEASQQDPLQAEVELAHGLHRRIVFETALSIAREQLNALLHRAPNAALPPAPPRTGAPVDASEAVDALTAAALEHRPEVAAASARISAEEARVALAWREYLPDVTLVGSYNGIMQEDDLKPFVGVQLSVPLQIGRRKAAVEEANARLEVARNQRLAVVDEVRLGVQSGLDRLAEAGHVVHLFRDRLLPAAGDQIAAARSGFETGRNSFFALVDAERNLRNVELGYEQALADVGRRRADLDRALGRIPGLSW
jgi:outer membrane protein TolC